MGSSDEGRDDLMGPSVDSRFIPRPNVGPNLQLNPRALQAP